MKSIFVRAANTFLVGILLFLIAENYLLFKNFPLLGAANENRNLQKTDMVNDLLGWTNDEDKACVSVENNKAIETTDEEARRVTPYVSEPLSYAMALGCSYTFGIGVSDHETFLWKSGECFSDIQFENYGVIGYGTHQCRVMMHSLLEHGGDKYKNVFYFFMEEHLRRNRGYIFAPLMNDQYVSHPWARLSCGKPEYHGGGIVYWAGSHIFRSVSFFQRLYIKCLTEHTFTEKDRVPLFNAILEEMLGEAQAHNAAFYVCFLESGDKGFIDPGLMTKGLNVIDLSFPGLRKPQYKVNGMGHPNAAAHERWAELFCSQMQGKL